MENTLASIIKTKRETLDWPIKYLAFKCQISCNALRNIESGYIKKPRVSTLEALAKNLDLDFAELCKLAGYSPKELLDSSREVNKESSPLWNYLKLARKQAHISIRQLADICEISPATIFNIETGSCKQPHLPLLKKLADALNVDVDILKEKAGYNVTTPTADLSLGELIRTAREAKNIGIGELADLCTISRQSLSRIENGKTPKPYKWTLLALARYLDLDINVLKQKAGYLK